MSAGYRRNGSPSLFWRDVIGRPKNSFVIASRQRKLLDFEKVAKDFRQPHVENLDDFGFVKEKIRRFDVAVDDAEFKRVLKRRRRLPDVVGSFRPFDRPTAKNDLLQALAVDELENQVPQRPDMVEVIRLDDVRMI